MKKTLLWLLTLLTMGISGFSQEIIIGTGTSTAYTSPFNNLYNNSWDECIYLSSEIQSAGAITDIAYYYDGTATSNYVYTTLKIYMGHTTRSAISSTTDWTPANDLTLVYDGTNITNPTTQGWFNITLDNPFVYNGTDNLVVVVTKSVSNYNGSFTYRYTSTSPDYRCMYRQSDSNPATYTSHPGSASGSRTYNRANIRLTMGNVQCPSPKHLTVSNITTNSADFAWSTGDHETDWEVFVSDNIVPDSNTVGTAVTDTTHTFTNLTPNTEYTAYVRANCVDSNAYSNWIHKGFRTACLAVDQLPYTEGFDTYGTGNLAYPYCWTKINTYTSANRPNISTTHYSGVGCLYFYTGASGTYNIAVTPEFDQSIAINTLQAEFMYRGSYPTDRLIVGVMTDYADASTFVPVDTVYPGASVTAWEERIVSFANYTGSGQYIAFKNEYTTTNGYAYMDELSIDLIPNCQKPQYVTLSNYTTAGCDVTWVPEGTESAWEVVAVPADADPSTGTPESAYSYPYTLTSLIGDTQYDVYVRAVCGSGDYSAWSFKATFTTNPYCTSPLNVSVSQISGTSAMVTWNSALYGATGYTVGYSNAGQGNWTTQSVTGNVYMLSGLTPNTDYDVFVYSECDQGSADTVFTDFTTHCLSGGDPFTEGTISTYSIPLNNYYDYTYSQQIYLASEMGGAATIDSIAFYYNYGTPSTEKTNVTLYLGHTTQSTFSGTSNYIPVSSLTQVYTGHMNCHQGWNTFVFTTPFQYNGTENLVVAVDDNSGDYDGSSYVFLAHNAGASRTVHYYDDGTNISPSDPTSTEPNMTTSTNRSNVKFFIPCDNTVSCVAPNIYVSGVDANSITVAWAPGNTETSWDMEYSTDGTNWTSEGAVTTSPYTISGLTDNTDYFIRIRSICGGTYSDYSLASARTACADMTTLPFIENFDSYTGSTTTTMAANNLPYCWSYLNEGSNASYSGYPILYSSTASAASGSNALRFYTYTPTTYDDQIAILPALDVTVNPLNTLQVAFDLRDNTSTYPFHLDVGVMTDPTDRNTFDLIQTITTSSTTYENYEIPFSSYTGTGKYIALRASQPVYGYNYGYVDNVRVEPIPDCPRPTDVTLTNPTANSVTLNWTEAGTATSWVITYGPAGFIPGTAVGTTELVSDNPYTVTGLNPSTTYDFYVQADCGGSYSNYSNVRTASTECGAISVLPFMENFEAHNGYTSTSASVNNLPYCWSNLNTGTSSSYSGYPIIYTSATYAASGSKAMRFYTLTTSGTYSDQVAILPEFDVNANPMNTLQLTFDARQNTSSYTFTLIVGVMTDPAVASTFTPVQTVNVTSTSYSTFEVPFTQYTGTGSYIAIKAPQPTTGNNYGYVDNIMVGLVPLCNKPTSVMASNVTATTADINWMPGGSETGWELVVVPAGMSISAGTAEPVTSHPYTLSNLSPSTAYDVYVRADCGTGTDFSSWSQVAHFTTTPICSAPTDVTVSQVAGSSALLTWTPAVFGATAYTVAYTETGMDNWATQSVTGNSIMLSGLTPETAYTVTVTSECDEGTAPAVTNTFTTGCLYGGNYIVGDGTTGTYNIPLNTYYNYSYVQELYLSNEINNSGNINSIGFQYIYTTAQTKSNQSIYLAETDLTNLSTWIPFDSLTLVYQGSITYNNAGSNNWVTIPLTTPFNYSGNRNLVVVIKNDHGAYTTSNNNTFNAHSASGKTLHYYSDESAFSFSSPETPDTYSSRNNIKFGMACDNTVTCIAPNVYVSEVTESSITLDWAPGNGESSWELEVSTDGANWTPEGTVSSYPYTFNNLNSNTLYHFRMRSLCGGDYSDWVQVSERTECSDIVTLPYLENFDTYTGSTSTSMGTNNLPYCWSYLNEGSNSSYSGYPILYSSTAYAASGSNSLRFYTYTPTTYDDQIAILPAIDVNVNPLNTLQVAFDLRDNTTSYPFKLDVGIMTDPTDPNTFFLVHTINSSSITYEGFEVPFDSYTGTGKYIALRASQPTTGYNYGYVDNVRVELIPECPRPIDVTSYNATTNSVTVGWTEVGTATSWVITYGPAGFIPGTPAGTTEQVSTNPYTVTGLNPSTTYDFYVQADCGGSYSNYSNVCRRSTECGLVSVLPFMENFDTHNGSTSTSVSVNNLPSCWSNFNTGSNTSYHGYPIIYTSATYAASGNNAVRFYTFTSTSYSDQVAILPQLDVNTFPMNTLQLTFDARRMSSSYSFNLDIGVMTDPTNISSFTSVQTVNVTSTTYNTFEVPFTSYTGTGSYIAIKAPQPTSSYNEGYIDNIVVDIAPLCDKPTNVTASNITATTANINWLPGGSETDWEVVAVPAGMGIATGTPEQASTHPYTLTNLSDNTAYDVYVRADCGTGTDFSSWSQAGHFTTTPFCSAPTDVTVSQVAGTSALLTWTPAVFGATAYTVAYTETGMNNWTTQSVTGNSYMLSGLTPETAYTVTITSECDQGTAPAVTKTFTTGCLSGGGLHIGTGTETTDYFPEYSLYEYSYTQQIFLASELGNAADISSISFECTTVADPTRNLQIYLMHTSSASGSSWLTASSAQQVYSGNHTFVTGWNTFNFTTPFQYNGTDNLAVIVVDVTGTWTSTNQFSSHTTSQSLCRYVYQDGTAFGISSTPSGGTSTTTRNNVIFGLPCDYTVTCIAPNVYASDVTESSITLSWVPGNSESSWELEISTDNATWTSEGTVTTSPYTLSNLNSNTLYYFRMRSVCGGGDYSIWATGSQRTDCGTITTLPYTEGFDIYGTGTTVYPSCWSRINTYTSGDRPYVSSTHYGNGVGSLYFYATSTSYNVAITPQFDASIPVNTLQASFMYRASGSTDYMIVGVMTDPSDINTFVPIDTVHPEPSSASTWVEKEVAFNGYTGTGQYIAFYNGKPTTNCYSYMDELFIGLIPTCPKPTQVHVVNSSTSSIELGWTENGPATEWEIEYGPAGFTQGSGTVEPATTNPYTINNLTTATTYDFYVRAVCGAGDTSYYAPVFTATTECDAVNQLPYTENFDAYGTGTGTYPLCWGKINTYAGGDRPYVSSTDYAGGGSLYFYAQSATYNIAIVPQFDASIPVNTLQATFMYRASSTSDYMVVGVMTNPNDASTFVPVDTVHPGTSATTWEEKEVVFSGYTGTGHYIAFYNGKPTVNCYSYMDELVIDLIPTCPKPHDVHITNATVNSIELGWTEVGSATSWEIAYGAPGFDLNNASEATFVTANSNPFTITNLNSTTPYEFYVRALCSSTDISNWSISQQGSTTMAPVGLPYTADFSANDAWVLNNGSCTNYWAKGTVSGTAALFVTDNGTSPNYTTSSTSVVAAQKLFTVGTADSITITFDVAVKGESSYDYMKLFLAPASAQFPASTSAPSVGDYGYNTYSTNAYNFYAHNYGGESSTYPHILNQVNGTIHVVAKMPNPNANPNAGSTALLAFAWRNDGSVGTQPPATITNLSVTADGSSPVITNPTVATNGATGIGQTTATLNATITNPDNVTITAKGFQWKATQGGTYTSVTGTGANNGFSASLTGLTPNTQYTFKAYITYNGQTVEGSEMTFTTQEQGVEPCDVPTNLHTTEIQNESISIAWDANPNVNSWNIQYRPVGGQLSSASSTTNSYTITGLTMDTDYEIQVQAVCASGSSDWTSSITAHTTNVGVESWLANSVSLYPNPAKEVVNVQCTMYNVQSGGELHLFDVYGKLLQTVPVTGETTQINISGLAAGLYFVRVTTEEGTVTKQFVKR